MRRTEEGLIPTALAIAGAVQWVASCGGVWLVSATTRSTVSAGSGAIREGRVLSRVSPSNPSCMKRSRQRQTTVLPLPIARMTALVPSPSAVRTMIRARHTCFCGLLRSRMIDCKRTRSAAVTVMEIPLRIADNRTKSNLEKLFFGLFRQVISTNASLDRVASIRLRKNCRGKLLEERSLVDPTAKLDTALDQIGGAMSER